MNSDLLVYLLSRISKSASNGHFISWYCAPDSGPRPFRVSVVVVDRHVADSSVSYTAFVCAIFLKSGNTQINISTKLETSLRDNEACKPILPRMFYRFYLGYDSHKVKVPLVVVDVNVRSTVHEEKHERLQSLVIVHKSGVWYDVGLIHLKLSRTAICLHTFTRIYYIALILISG